jgi:hypothetical protein
MRDIIGVLYVFDVDMENLHYVLTGYLKINLPKPSVDQTYSVRFRLQGTIAGSAKVFDLGNGGSNVSGHCFKPLTKRL